MNIINFILIITEHIKREIHPFLNKLSFPFFIVPHLINKNLQLYQTAHNLRGRMQIFFFRFFKI